MKRILGVFAHPDDESFVCGGTIPKYAKNGWEVHLVCATRGEAGNRGQYGQIDADSLGAIRQKELESVAAYLKIANVTFLDYEDGTLVNVSSGDLEDILFRALRNLTPSIVITFEPGGISNHPDHIKLTRSTTFAFQKYMNALKHVRIEKISRDSPPRHARDSWQISFAEASLDLSSPKLYYACLPSSVGNYLVKNKFLPAEMFGKPWSTTPDKLVTNVIDIEDLQKKKINALLLHKTQEADVARFLADPRGTLCKQEYFILRMQGEREVFMGKNDRVSDRL